MPDDVSSMVLIDKKTGENYRFHSPADLRQFKYQRYIKRQVDSHCARSEEVRHRQRFSNDLHRSDTAGQCTL